MPDCPVPESLPGCAPFCAPFPAAFYHCFPQFVLFCLSAGTISWQSFFGRCPPCAALPVLWPHFLCLVAALPSLWPHFLCPVVALPSLQPHFLCPVATLPILQPQDDVIGPDRHDHGRLRQIGEAHQHIGAQQNARADKIPLFIPHQPQVQENDGKEKQHIGQIIVQRRRRAPAQAQRRHLPQEDHGLRHLQLPGTEKIARQRQQTREQTGIQVHAPQRVRLWKLRQQIPHHAGQIRGKKPHGIHMPCSHILEIRIIISGIP